MKVIAHGITDPKVAKYAIAKGVDFLEIDVAKKLLFNKFTAQHNGILGILGLGPILETLLIKEVRTRAFLDLKPISYRESFVYKLSELLAKLGIDNVRICGHNWKILSTLRGKINAKPYYTIKDEFGAEKFQKMLPNLSQPIGFSVKYNLINEKFIKRFKKKSTEIWAWTVNDITESKRLINLGVDGIITDNWESVLKLR